MELRYRPIVEALPPGDDEICEIGSGHRGLAAWTPRPVVGVEPRTDPKGRVRPDNLREVAGHAGAIPLPDRSVAAAVAVDTFEHIVPAERAPAIAEMKRVVRPGGRLLVIGPTGEGAARGDARLLELMRRRAPHSESTQWLEEHRDNGLPTVDGLLEWIGTERVARTWVRPVFNVRLWYLMHLAAIGALPRTGPAHPYVWAPFAAVARRLHRPPVYRWLVAAELD